MTRSNVSRHYRPKECPHEVSCEIDPHPGTSLTKEEHVSDYLYHDSLCSSRSYPITGTSCKQAFMGCCQGLPNTGQNEQHAKEDARQPSSEYVRDRDDEEVRKAQRDYIKACKQGKLLLVEVKPGSK